MHSRHSTDQNAAPLLARLADLRAELRRRDAHNLARLTGSNFSQHGPEEGVFTLKFWSKEIILSYPNLEAKLVLGGGELNPAETAILLYYFHTADGTPLSGRWISFSDLPGGRFYNQAFQGYTGKQLANVFGNERDKFQRSAERLGGIRQDFGDLAFLFPALPYAALLVVYWQGDEDFPSSYQILFDEATSHSLPTDVCAVAGSLLTKRLLSPLNLEG